MSRSSRSHPLILALLMIFAAGATFATGFISATGTAFAQGTSGSVSGTVTDTTGAIIPNASVQILNSVSGYTRTATTDANGQYRFFNLAFNTYRITVTAPNFQSTGITIDVNSVVPVASLIKLDVQGSNTSITVVDTGSDLVENDSTFHTDIDRSTIDKLPLESASSSLSSLVTLSSPGVASDSNGLFHGLGDHAENSFSVDGQPITDQQSKVFSNQLPSDAVQSLEVIDGAPPAEYGDKTSLVIKVTTRSGQGATKPTGSFNFAYGTFGSANGGGQLAYGGNHWGNFVSASGLNTGRFLDPNEFQVFHSKGNELNFFDRVDFQFNDADSIHTNLQYTRSWFQTPNSFDNLNIGATDPNGNALGVTDQRAKIETFDIAPTYTRVLNTFTVFNFGPYVRRDAFNYYPSKDPLADFGPLQQETVAQQRSLLNAGLHTDVSYVKGIHNIKIGGNYGQTFLRENDQIGLVDPNLNAPCLDANGAPLAGNCPAGGTLNPAFNPVLLPYDITRGGSSYAYHGRTVVKQLALYGQDQITAGNWLLNVGIRGDFYNGLAIQRQAEPRVGLSYSIKPSGTVLRLSYARTQETPFNENLVLSVKGCYDPVIQGIFQTLGSCTPAPFNPGFRNEFHAGPSAGLLQALCRERRVHLEVHPQCLRLRRPGQHSHHLPHRVAQLEDSRLRPPRQRPRDPRRQRLRRHVLRRRPLLQPAGRRCRCNARRHRLHTSLPHRPRREVQPDQPHSIQSALP